MAALPPPPRAGRCLLLAAPAPVPRERAGLMGNLMRCSRPSRRCRRFFPPLVLLLLPALRAAATPGPCAALISPTSPLA
ncbi:uncharacterized protein SCHCODRAFT_02627202 [Schizophyllum commune H4-8]|uniref:uncharacterized protein n=1 Tax=Schizophyllum commune (strain H4-8 / FGSC 9210) TaxID=578458 RepID=UPI00215FB39E|nr:uncharacterized protein SCHCODRAFT_02627202 [Schizophyllum commune H4-8]KAI5892816.1 hypothetical protein SCHCODRAFT_02627202 [Schizophyllum commune H4-8]